MKTIAFEDELQLWMSGDDLPPHKRKIINRTRTSSDVIQYLNNKHRVSGLYYLLGSEGDVLYVGKSLDVPRRIIGHIHNEKIKKHDDITSFFMRYIPNTADMVILEPYEILKYRPKYNKQCVVECEGFSPSMNLDRIVKKYTTSGIVEL